jgi:predicted RNA-binding Zn ribbon-like protein
VRTQDEEFRFTFIGGALCLDFVNTASWHLRSAPYEHLRSYAHLVAWARQAAVVSDREAKTLLGRATAQEDAAEAARRGAIELREALFTTCLASRGGTPPDPKHLATINRTLQLAMARAALVPAPAGLAWGWPPHGERPLDWMLWAVARSSAELLASPSVADLAVCAAEGCGWLFLDRTHRRRWCSMRSCGNRAKAARHYERSKVERAAKT